MFTPILIVDDDADASERLSAALGHTGLCAAVVPQVHHCVVLARQLAPLLVILSLDLREVDGLRVLRTLRRHGFGMPVLALVGDHGADVEETVRAAGADRVLPRDVPLAELVAEVVELWRATHRGDAPPVPMPAWTPPPELTAPARAAGPSLVAAVGTARAAARDPAWAEVRFGDVVLRPAARQLWRRGRAVELRPREMDVLVALCGRAGRVVSREALLRAVWGDEPTASGRAVDNCIVALRRALEETPAFPRHICTVRKFGYRLDLEPLPTAPRRDGGRPGDAVLRPYAGAAAGAARDRCA